MKGYISKRQKVLSLIERQFPECSIDERKRLFRQMFAKEIVGKLSTIGSVIENGKRKIVITKP